MRTSGVSVELCDPREATHLLKASHELMNSLFPSEANNYLSIDALCQADIQFFGARHENALVGCGALALREGYGEIKSMFVDPQMRGAGIAGAILDQIEAEARVSDLNILRLETGTLLHEAHRLYGRYGFQDCQPFGDYDPGPYNIFMEKRLD